MIGYIREYTVYKYETMAIYDNTGEYFVHHRPLGTKIQGQYLNVPWSDIALQNVPLETTLSLEIENIDLECQRRMANIVEENKSLMVGSKNVVKDIIGYEIQNNQIKRGEKPSHIKGMSHKYDHTGRPIPKHTKKKYSTKPRIKGKAMRGKYFKGAM